jgi:hypothetical protein
MAKINLTRKSHSEQLRILNDYILRRAQHKNQGDVTIDNLVKKFRHNKCFTNKAKAVFFSKLLWTLEENNKKYTLVEVEN